MEIRISLTQKQLEFDRAINEYPIVLYGGSRGGGKSHGLRLIMLKRRFQYPNSIGYLFRKTFPELEANHIAPLFAQFPDLQQFYNQGRKTLRLPNASELRFAYAENEKDLRKFQGREIHDLAIEEAGDWSEESFEYLHASNRSSLTHITPRAFLTANPGGIGHKWLKRRFVERKFRPGERPEDHHFIPARIADNPALTEADPFYQRRLESIKNETLKKAWIEGDWDVQAGQFFEELDRKIHLVKPFEIPDRWQRFGAYDYGFGHPAFAGWFAVDEDGVVYLYRVQASSRTKVDEFAERMNVHPDTKLISTWWAGHDCWARKPYAFGHELNQPTIAEAFTKHKIFLRPANVDRIQGWNQLRQYLSPFTGPLGQITSNFKIFDTADCNLVFDSIARCTHDPDRIEDVLKVDAENGDVETGDDGADMCRYGLMSRPIKTKPEPKYDPMRYRKKLNRVTGWTV